MKQVALEPVNDLHTRGRIYRHLSEALSCPEEEVVLSELILNLQEDLNYLRPFLKGEEFCEILSRFDSISDLTSLNVEYTRLFRGPVKALVYPYESMYVEGEVFGETTRDVVKKYADAGLEIAMGFKDLPDHIKAEMEFMYFLCDGEVRALHGDGDAERSKLRGFQHDFFKKHLSRWAPQFCRSLGENTTEPYFKLIQCLMAAFMDSEKKYFDIVSSRLMQVT